MTVATFVLFCKSSGRSSENCLTLCILTEIFEIFVQMVRVSISLSAMASCFQSLGIGCKTPVINTNYNILLNSAKYFFFLEQSMEKYNSN